MSHRPPAAFVVQSLVFAGAAIAGLACESAAPPLPPPPAPDGARAFAHLERQVAFGPRLPGSAAAAECRAYFLEQLRLYTSHTGEQRFVVANPYGTDSLRLVNVLAHFHPERAVRVLFGAHYDSRPWADQDSVGRRDQPVPGANDGASGAAVLLEVAAALAVWDPGIGVDLVFFDGEDYGREGDLDYYLLGSKHFVATMGAYRPRAFLLVDMVGERDLDIPMEALSLQLAPELTRLVFAVAESLRAPGFRAAPGRPVTDDHVPFLRAGIPAVDLIDLDYPEWHTTRDLPDRCAPASLESVARVLLGTLHRLGASPASP